MPTGQRKATLWAWEMMFALLPTTSPASQQSLDQEKDFQTSMNLAGAYRLKANEKRRSQSPDAMARMRSQEVIFSFNPVLQVVFCTASMRKIIHLLLGHLAASCLMCLQAKQQGWWARTQTISKGKNLESIPDPPLPFSFPPFSVPSPSFLSSIEYEHC